jgi:hypothetical protein
MLAHCVFIRFELHGLIETSLCVIMPCEAELGYATVIECDCVARFKPNCFVVIVDLLSTSFPERQS